MSKVKSNYEIISDKTQNPVVDSAYVKHGTGWLDTVINQTVTTLNGKADKSYVDTQLATKASISQLESKADSSTVSQLQVEVNKKANTSTVLSLSTQVSTNTTKTEDLQSQIDSLVIESGGDSNAEVVQARTDTEGTTHNTLKSRIDTDVNNVKSNLNCFNSVDLLAKHARTTNGTNNGVSFTWSGLRCTVNGTATSTASSNIITSLPDSFKAGETYYFKVDTSDSNVYVKMFLYVNGTTEIYDRIAISSDKAVTFPDNLTNIIIRLEVANGKTVNGVISVNILNALSNEDLKKYTDNNALMAQPVASLSGISNLNDITSNGIWLIDDSKSTSMTNIPEYYRGQAFWLISSVIETNSTTNSKASVQIIIGYSSKVRIYRRSANAGTWQSWTEINHDTDIVNIQSVLSTDVMKVTSSSSLPGCDLNDISDSKICLLADNQTYLNKPVGFTIGFLMSAKVATNWVIQTLFSFNGNKLYKRRGNINSNVWESWQEVSGNTTTNNYTNEYKFEQYSNTYNISASPTITTDTNSYLASTNNTTDRTADILTLLNTTGVCRLGKGEYYVKNLVMPNNTMICGCGRSSVIRLIGGDGFTIKLGDYCTVENLTLSGNASAINVSETLGNRHGIIWSGNYTESEDSSAQPKVGMISDVFILNYTGGGITCYDTGYGTFNHIEVSNCFVSGCSAGINISYLSEFHKFTNVRCYGNYYGCVNNGGNNVFVNCDFSTNKMGFLMDNSTGQSPNNSHGSAIGCVFNHTNSNTGVGIKIINCDNGFVFTGCQIFFSQIYLKDSDGVVVSDTNFGANNCNITVDGGGVVLFANNLHQSAPTISVSNNNMVHFTNCYVRSTGAIVSN